MGTAWQKFLTGLRLFILVALVVHIILFVILNYSAVVDTRLSLIYKAYDRPNFLLVMLLTSIISIFGWWLIRTSFKTFRQLTSSRNASRVNKVERDLADMKAKAGMLQTRPNAEGVTVQVNHLGDAGK